MTTKTATSKKTFSDLGLSARALKAIDKKGFEEPTAIQTMTIPVMLKDDRNIIAQAQTGTGKTAAFGLPLIELIDVGSKSVQAIILVPTRELAIQVAEEINSLKGEKDLKIVPIYGGQSIDEQFRRLKKGVHIVVGSPGRVLDHLNRKTLRLDNIEQLILDEADEMLNMGFIKDIEKIMKYTNPNKRTLLFSATMPQRIKDLARKYMDGYELLAIKKDKMTGNLTEQIYFEVKPADKFEALCRIIDMEENFYGLVFCRTKRDVNSVVSHLLNRGYDADAIHGDIVQSQRERTLTKFRTKKINVLVATDVAARGIDVIDLTHVINFALPQDPESYVHRIGRTGRAGKGGTAITFITPSEYKQLMFIQRFAGTAIKQSQIPGVKDIIKTKKNKIYDDLAAILKDDIDAAYHDWAQKLLEHNKPAEILAAVLNYCFEDDLNPDAYREIKGGGPRERQLDNQGKARLFVGLGKKDRMNPRKLLDLILSRVSVKPREVKDILIMDSFSFVTVPFKTAEDILTSFQEKGKKPLFTRARKKK